MRRAREHLAWSPVVVSWCSLCNTFNQSTFYLSSALRCWWLVVLGLCVLACCQLSQLLLFSSMRMRAAQQVFITTVQLYNFKTGSYFGPHHHDHSEIIYC